MPGQVAATITQPYPDSQLISLNEWHIILYEPDGPLRKRDPAVEHLAAIRYRPVNEGSPCSVKYIPSFALTCVPWVSKHRVCLEGDSSRQNDSEKHS